MGNKKHGQSTPTVRPNGEAIRTLRKSHGFKSQDELAIAAGICLRTVRKLEHGEEALPYSIRCIAQALEVPYTALVMPGDNAVFQREEHIALSDAYKAVTVEIKGDIKSVDHCTAIREAVEKVANTCGFKYQVAVTLISSGSVLIRLHVHESDVQRIALHNDTDNELGPDILRVSPTTKSVMFWFEPIGNSRLNTRILAEEYLDFHCRPANLWSEPDGLKPGSLDQAHVSGRPLQRHEPWSGRYLFYPDEVTSPRPLDALRKSLNEAFAGTKVRVRAIIDGTPVSFFAGGKGVTVGMESVTP
ncbi:MAG: helix-turn-helix transcriptional regulator [Planctomycetales bacterium]|nr:helix-turn-helix transcriptional regulator [Planctomycetales bacterium]